MEFGTQKKAGFKTCWKEVKNSNSYKISISLQPAKHNSAHPSSVASLTKNRLSTKLSYIPAYLMNSAEWEYTQNRQISNVSQTEKF